MQHNKPRKQPRRWDVLREIPQVHCGIGHPEACQKFESWMENWGRGSKWFNVVRVRFINIRGVLARGCEESGEFPVTRAIPVQRVFVIDSVNLGRCTSNHAITGLWETY